MPRVRHIRSFCRLLPPPAALLGLLLAGVLLGSGCASLQPSAYVNTSRDGENRVIARGQAANNAAWVHASSATLGHGAGGASPDLTADTNPARTGGLEQHVRQIYEQSLTSAGRALSGAIGRSIHEALQ
jgi:hypothetical protein